MFVYNILFSIFFSQAPFRWRFHSCCLKIEMSLSHLPLQIWHFPRSSWDLILRLLHRMRNHFNKVGDGLYIKTEVGGMGRFEGSILLPKWNFWHQPAVLEFPFLFYSQDCGKEWFYMIRVSHHHFIVLPCSVTCCKQSLDIPGGFKIRKTCSVTILILLNQLYDIMVITVISHRMCFCRFPEHFHTHSHRTSNPGLPLSGQVLSSEWVAAM